MVDQVTFTLDGREVSALPGETIWEVARREGTTIPHLCHKPAKGYRPDGNCRACMVAIEGERVLAASCIRQPAEGMAVTTGGARERKARAMVLDMLAADMPETPRDASSHFGEMAALTRAAPAPDGSAEPAPGSYGTGQALEAEAPAGGATPRADAPLPPKPADRIPLLDDSHVAMSVNLDACIQCGLCVRACREVQVNDVIGMAGRGADAYPVFDFADPMGDSTCVACGECVQACPTGALTPATIADTKNRETIDREVNSVCPYCGVGCQLTFKIKDEKIKYVEGANGPSNQQRLCVKGRFGFDYVDHPHRLTVPLIRRTDAPPRV